MTELEHLLDNNREWAKNITTQNPDFFSTLAHLQEPDYLWIGCSDSRVPANQLLGLLPGDIFVHRNVANVVAHTDLNCLTVLNYAVEHLQVKHIILCGHYGCGGVKAAMANQHLGLIDNWLRNIRDVYFEYDEKLNAITDDNQRLNRLCELNVEQQTANIARTSIVQSAWQRGQALSIHGWIYGLEDGLLKTLVEPIIGMEQVAPEYHINFG